MSKRTITAIVLLLILVPLLVVDVLIIPFQIVVGLLLIAGVLEILNMYNKEYKLFTKIYVVLLTLLLYSLIILVSNPLIQLNSIYILIGILFITFSHLLLSTFSNDFTGDNLGKHLSTIFYVGIASGSLVSIRLEGIRFVIFLLMITSLTDIFAYIIGIKFGKHKMAPTISPKKSWEGAIAGTTIAVTVASLFGIFYGKIFTNEIFNADNISMIIDKVGNVGSFANYLKVIIVILLALLISISGQLGDLVASKMKRNYDIKDFGKIFPGHGGVMDRFDSAFFASMILFLILLIIKLF